MEGTGMSENGRKFKEAKGVVTRRAMETQLQKKLGGQIADNAGDKQGLKDLQRKDKDMKI